MTASHRRVTAAVCSLLVASMVATGCSNKNQDANPSTYSSETLNTTSEESTSITEAPPATFPSRDQIHGIVAGQLDGDGGYGSIGVIDPETGVYTKLGLLPPRVDANSGRSFSPDFQKYAETTRIDNTTHSGWLNADGSFTDMTPELSTDDFGTNVSSRELGFDKQNRFYWSIETETDEHSLPDAKYYRVDANRLGSAREEIPESDAGLGAPAGYPPGRAADGTLKQLPRCVRSAYSTLAPDTYFGVVNGGSSPPSSVGTQIYRTTQAGINSSGGCIDEKSIGLLPATNRLRVTQPIPSPDGSKVAFFSTSGALYIVDGFGRSRPVKIAESIPDAILFEWL